MKFHLLLAVFLAFFLVSAHSLEVHRSTVSKTIAENPTLGIVHYQGTEPALQQLRSTLIRCGWFRVLSEKQAGRAQIQLKVGYRQWNGHEFQGEVRASGETRTVTGTGRELSESSYQFTDSLLKVLFNVPALCTRRLAYVVTAGNSMKEIFLCNFDGTGQKRFTHNNAISTEPSWGPGGALVYTLARNNALQVVYSNVIQERQRVVSRGRGLNASASLSPDGRFLALPLSFRRQVDLYVKELATGKLRQLSNSRSVESSPAWSPDGRQICYVSDLTGRPRLYLIGSDGRGNRRLQTGGNEAVSPDWSPVSGKLCYATRSNAGQFIIAVLDMSTPGAVPEFVTPRSGDWEAPSWAPDGRHIICTRASGSRKDLYIVDSWFKEAVQLSRNARISLPAWEPAF